MTQEEPWRFRNTTTIATHTRARTHTMNTLTYPRLFLTICRILVSGKEKLVNKTGSTWLVYSVGGQCDLIEASTKDFLAHLGLNQ